MSRQVLFPLSFTAMSDLFALMSLFVWTGMSQSIVTALFSVKVDGPYSKYFYKITKIVRAL